MIIDELRIIEHTNTQVRFLPIISQILRTIGSRSSSLNILESVLLKWSIEQERNSTEYKNHNGILSNNEKPTTAFQYYIELMMNFGFITKINEVVRNSKYGILFLTLDKLNFDRNFFSQIEKMFFFFFIIQKDADNIIMLLQMIKENDGIADQTLLRANYESYLKKRLQLKANNSHSFSQNAVLDKLRKVEYEWQNAKEYSKHIIPPRMEWLVDIGILKKNETKRIKRFEFTEFGIRFYNSLEFVDDSELKDVNYIWLEDKLVYEFQYLFKNENLINDFNSLDEYSKNNFLGEILPLAYKELDNDGLRRVSGLPFYLFIMIIGLSKYKISVPFSSLKARLTQSFSTNEYTFSFREASRINESYLTVSINNI